jgi:hypothetical protein
MLMSFIGPFEVMGATSAACEVQSFANVSRILYHFLLLKSMSRCWQEPVICYESDDKSVVPSYYARFFDGHRYRRKAVHCPQVKARNFWVVSIWWMQKVALQESVENLLVQSRTTAWCQSRERSRNRRAMWLRVRCWVRRCRGRGHIKLHIICSCVMASSVPSAPSVPLPSWLVYFTKVNPRGRPPY